MKFSEKEEWNEKGPNSKQGKKEILIDMMRKFAGTIEGVYNKKEEVSFEAEGQLSAKIEKLSQAVKQLMVRGVNHEDVWEEEH